MPLELLREIAKQELPWDVETTGDVDKLRVLQAAVHIEAELPHPTAPVQKARVWAITAKGWSALTEQGRV